jgi:hypothetical protein
VIRQAISCDICGTEKKQTNHWFVAYDQGGELRVSGWSSRNRLRPGSKHLCGQTCLHKLLDDFMAKAVKARTSQTADDAQDEVAQNEVAQYEVAQNRVVQQATRADTSLTSPAAFSEFESSARLITTPKPVLPARPVLPAKPIEAPAPATPVPVAPAPVTPTPIAPARAPLRGPMELIVVPARPRAEEPVPPTAEPPRYASRNWRAEAWERERERELRSGERHPGMARRRFS